MLASTFKNALPTEMRDREQLLDHLEKAMRCNSIETMSLLLSVIVVGTDKPFRKDECLATHAENLLRCTFDRDGAECALSLLNCLAESVLERHSDTQRAERASNEPPPKRNKVQRQQEVERHCSPGPDSTRLVELAKEALAYGTTSDHPSAPPVKSAKRVARACLLHTHRLRKTIPSEGLTEGGDIWPPYEADMPRSMSSRGGFGGFDLSEGAEPTPVQWVNEVRTNPASLTLPSPDGPPILS